MLHVIEIKNNNTKLKKLKRLHKHYLNRYRKNKRK